MPPKRKKKKTVSAAPKYLKKDRLGLIEDLRKENFGNVVEKCVAIAQEGIHLKYSDSRRRFVTELTGIRARKQFADVVRAMVKKYIDLLAHYTTGKRFAKFEQAWLGHIEEYFTELPPPTPTAVQKGTGKAASSSQSNEVSLYSMWQTLLASMDSSTSVENQRIVVSTIAFIVYDLMTAKVKEYKIDLASSSSSQDEATVGATCGTVIQLHESNVSLYRYGGFALHSLLKKYNSASDQHGRVMLQLLRQFKIKDGSQLPNAIHYLDRGGLDLMKTCMLPYLRIVIEKVSALVNEDKQHELGAHMIEAASKEIEGDADLFRTFVKCSNDAQVEVTDPAVAAVMPRLHKELSKKMFHARVNEFMTASVEIELERNGKVVQVEQSLRDKLKTFSGLKTR